MNIDKAIEILESEVECWVLHPMASYPKAFKLGIEALKAWKEHRGTGSLMSPLLLPGETIK